MKKENITIEEAIYKFTSQIHEAVYDCDGGISWHDTVYDKSAFPHNSCDGFRSFYNYGFRSIIQCYNREDSSYHICKEQTNEIEKSRDYFNRYFFNDLTEEERFNCKTYDEYLSYLLELEPINYLPLQQHDEALSRHYEDERTIIVFDTWYYSKDNTLWNKSGKDVVLIQVHINPNDQVFYISATGKDAYIGLFDAEEFMNNMQYNCDSFLLNMSNKIYECMSGEAFIDPQSDLIV